VSTIIVGADIAPTRSNFELFQEGNMKTLLGRDLYTFLRKVSRFLERYQKLENQLIFSSEPYDPHNLLLRWRNHINELNIELFNSFISIVFSKISLLTTIHFLT